MTGNKKVGFLTIGQAPRDDVLNEILPRLSPLIKIIQAGALDDLEKEEITSLGSEPGKFPLITRLRNGSTVTVSREKIVPLLQAKIDKLEAEGAEIIVLLCTEDFADLNRKKNCLLPFELMKRETIKLSPSQIIVFIPLEEQKAMVRAKWQALKIEIFIEVLNPYKSDYDLSHLASKIVRKENCLAIFDCIGYSIAMTQSISKQLAFPCLGPRLVLIQEINRLIAGE